MNKPSDHEPVGLTYEKMKRAVEIMTSPEYELRMREEDAERATRSHELYLRLLEVYEPTTKEE